MTNTSSDTGNTSWDFTADANEAPADQWAPNDWDNTPSDADWSTQPEPQDTPAPDTNPWAGDPVPVGNDGPTWQPQQQTTPPPATWDGNPTGPAPQVHSADALISDLPERNNEKSARGWRRFFKLGPSPAELQERAEIDTIRAPLKRPMTFVVANPKGSAGKSLSVNEPVLTPAGWQRIGNIQVGDQVAGRDGLFYEVLGVFPQGERELYKVTLTDGTSILADGEHLWEVESAADRGTDDCTFDGCNSRVLAGGLCSGHYDQQRRGLTLRTKRTGDYSRVDRVASGNRAITTDEMREHGLKVNRSGTGRGVRHSFFLPVATAVKFDPTDVPLDPYLLGLLLGDGCMAESGSPGFTTKDEELHQAVAERLPNGAQVRHKAGYDYRIIRSAPSGTNPVTNALRDLGLWGHVSHNKFIPENYKFGDIDTRLAVLQGLMDTDGWATQTAGYFNSASAQLAEDVKFLAESLGCVVNQRTHPTTYTYMGERRNGRDTHELHIKAPAGLELFRLTRKQELMSQGRLVPYRAIDSIEPAGRGEAVCISVASPDHLFLTRGCVPTHNTPTTLLAAGGFGSIRGGSTIAWDNNELRGTMPLRTQKNGCDMTVRDLIEVVGQLSQPQSRFGDLQRYLRHQGSGQYDALMSTATATRQVTGDEFYEVHQLLQRFVQIIGVDTGNNEKADNWRAAISVADALIVPVKWSRSACVPAVQMLEDLQNNPDTQDLVRNTILVASNGPGETRSGAREKFYNYFADRVRAIIEIPVDNHIAEECPIEHHLLSEATRRQTITLCAKIAEVFHEAPLEVPRRNV